MRNSGFASSKSGSIGKTTDCPNPLGAVIRSTPDAFPGGGLSFLLGVNHGLFCIGCCWALMLLMFAVGTGSVGWMLALGAIMASEKYVRWGKAIGKPLGAVLIEWSAWIVVQNVRIG
jgi:predicted metal-binding membrane protein